MHVPVKLQNKPINTRQVHKGDKESQFEFLVNGIISQTSNTWDNYTNLVYLSLIRARVTLKSIQSISTLSKLKTLIFRKTRLDDRKLSVLSAMTGLEYLDISKTKVTAMGLEFIEDMKSLRYLNLAGIDVCDDSIEALAGMHDLEYLNLSGSVVTNDGLLKLGDCKKLTVLNLSDTHVSCVSSITGPYLRALDVSGTHVDDDGLRVISKLNSLTHLYICRLVLTDWCIPCLSCIRQRITIKVNSTAISEHGLDYVASFQNIILDE
jgi:hypothetical protein